MLSNDVHVCIPIGEENNHSCNLSIDTSRRVLAQFLAFLPGLVFGCERKRGTSFRPGSPTIALAIHGQRRIANGADVKNSRMRGTDTDLLSGPQFVAGHSKSGEQREHRTDTNDLF
jgi:hypothetical protein